jgi:hypothetical protein
MTRDDYLTVAIFSIFILAPFISIGIEKLQESAKNNINRKLSRHGLRLRQRG